MTTTAFTLTAVTTAMGEAQDSLRKLELVKFPRDVSCVPAAAHQALDVLDKYGYNLVTDEELDSLTNGTYHGQMTGIKALNASIRRHNAETTLEHVRRREEAREALLRRERITAQVRSGLLTGSARPAWLG